MEKVHDAARGRVWSGTDAKAKGLVDGLGGFWTAAQTAASLGAVSTSSMTFRVYPRPKSLLTRLGVWSNDLDASMGTLRRVESLLEIPALGQAGKLGQDSL